MPNSEVVLKSENEDSAVTELEDLCCSSDASFTPTAINVENSKDVIIGPVTQFHGPVTIYQNVTQSSASRGTIGNGSANTTDLNGKLVKSESTCSDSPHAEKPKNSFLYSKHVKYLGISLVVIVILVTTTCVLILPRKTEKSPETPDTNTATPRLPLGPGAIIEKKIWGGRATLNFSKPLPHPTHFVIVSHTVTPTCSDFPACSQRVQSMQDYHVGNLKSPDIGYNFVIGGDGNAYVGRGWDIRNFHMDDSIGISFIGNFLHDHLTTEMISVAKKLLDEGVKSGKLARDYKLVAHNQTFRTESPGPNVYKEIKNWPHFDAGIYYSR
ncbi:Peptidoglycan-recognition protein SC2-like Protein [Tribolium castaneum]|uniref:Peptidoglycan-recognition protein SC2-like Protein n=2 Tax=Tribolium castaneum TaxID=7070 RepID=D6WIN8_TRICA|nr:Peptidoglycan-recognition protein SC2-like Protein [Tribolium castaneum]